jgi:hypothetical protein
VPKGSISGHGCIKKYDQIELIYLTQGTATHISLHSVYIRSWKPTGKPTTIIFSKETASTHSGKVLVDKLTG